MFGQFTLRDETPAMVHQIRQHPELMSSKPHRDSVKRYLRCSRVQRYGPAMKFRLDHARGSANQSAQSSKDFFHAKGFHHIVVRTAIDALNFFVPAAPCGEDEDGHRDSSFAPSSKHGQTVDCR